MQDASAAKSFPPDSQELVRVPRRSNSQRDLCGPDPTGYLMQQQYLQPKPDANRQLSHIGISDAIC